MNYGLSPHTKKALRLKVPAHLKIKSDMTVHLPKPNSVISDQESNMPASVWKESTNLASILNHQAKQKQNKRVEFIIDSPKMSHTMPVKAFRSVDAHRTPVAQRSRDGPTGKINFREPKSPKLSKYHPQNRRKEFCADEDSDNDYHAKTDWAKAQEVEKPNNPAQIHTWR